LEEWTKKELAQECISLGVDSNGNKEVLIQRIKEAWLTKGKMNLNTEKRQPGIDTNSSKNIELPSGVGSTVSKKAKLDIPINTFNAEVGSKAIKEETNNIESLSQDELILICQKMGLPCHGSKIVLVQRIKEAVKENDNNKRQSITPKRKSASSNVKNQLTPQEKRRKRINYLEMHTGKVSPPNVDKHKSVAGPNIEDTLISDSKTMTAVEGVKSRNETNLSSQLKSPGSGSQNASKKVLKKYKQHGIVKRLDAAPILSSRHKRSLKNVDKDCLKKVIKITNNTVKNKMDPSDLKKKLQLVEKAGTQQNSMLNVVKLTEGKVKTTEDSLKKPVIGPNQDKNLDTNVTERVKSTILKVDKVIKTDAKAQEKVKDQGQKNKRESSEGLPASKKFKKSDKKYSDSKDINRMLNVKIANKPTGLGATSKPESNIKSKTVTSKKLGIKKFDKSSKTKEKLGIVLKDQNKEKSDLPKKKQSDQGKKVMKGEVQEKDVIKKTNLQKPQNNENKSLKQKPSSVSSTKRKSTDSLKELKSKKIKKT